MKANIFAFDGKCYRQTDGMAMDSTPVFANLVMEEVDKIVMDAWKLKSCFRHTDNTFEIWQYKLSEFFMASNSIDRIHKHQF